MSGSIRSVRSSVSLINEVREGKSGLTVIIREWGRRGVLYYLRGRDKIKRWEDLMSGINIHR